MRYFMVVNADDPKFLFEFVVAETEDDLIDQILEFELEEGTLKEHVDEFIVNWSLLENFFKDDKGHLFNDFGEFREDLQKRYNKDKDRIMEYAEKRIEKNVKKFFIKRPEFGELYLKKYHNQDDGSIVFPRELYKYVFLNNGGLEEFIIKEVTGKIRT